MARRCAYCGSPIQDNADPLTHQQRMVVDFLAAHDRPVSAERIAAHIRVRTRFRERTYREDTNNVRVVICNIRSILGSNAIQTIPGQGYFWTGCRNETKNKTAQAAE